MDVFVLEKGVFDSFLRELAKDFEVIAPVKTDVVRFMPVKDSKAIYLEKNSYFPVKEYFFRKQEVIFEFDGNDITVPEAEAPRRVFFGVRRCDLNGIYHQDIVFMHDVHDMHYKALRENSILIGYHCNEAPSPYCFCNSLELIDFHDLMFYDRDGHFLVEVGTEKGRLMIRKYAKFFSKHNSLIPQKEKKIPGADRLEVKDISRFYHHPGWKKGVDICLSCGACTNLCPTCYCFEFHDDVKAADINKGERKRQWSSCQLQEFTRVAGDFVFRKEREKRFKHRIFHQLQYFKEKYHVQMCVGCGRCIEGCPTRIDFVDMLNEMQRDEKKQN